MTVEFNMRSLDTFSNAAFGNENDIVNIARDNEKAASLKKNGTFSSSNIFRFMRGGSARKANNEARAELLKSLGKAFGLEGVGTGKRGETTFSGEFMDKLKKLIGPSFKAEDFGVPERGGAVTSGKPLTFRRVQAIMTQAANFASGNKFDLAEYQNKFNNLLKESGSSLETLDADIKKASGEQESFLEMFRFVRSSLNFLDTEMNHPEQSVVRNNPTYEWELETEGAGYSKLETMKPFIVYNKETGQKSYVNELDRNFRNTVFSKAVGGLAIHTENCPYKFTDKDGNTYYDIRPQKKYVTDLMKSFIKVSVDSFYKAKMTGKLNEFRHHIAKDGGACMEDKTTKFIKFRDKVLDQIDANAVDKDLERDLEGILLKGDATSLDECVTGMITNVVSREDLQDLDSWEEYAPHVKKELVGTFHPITKPVLDNNGNPVKIFGKFQFEPVLVNGQPEFRKLTEEDVDRIGKMIYDDAFKF